MKEIDQPLDLTLLLLRVERHDAPGLMTKLAGLMAQVLLGIIEGFIYLKNLKWRRKKSEKEIYCKPGMKTNVIISG